MIPNPIHKALSSIRKNGVKYLLMGGQACVLYGAAEFSRDLDLALFLDKDNLTALQSALSELQASPIAVPPFSWEFLERGHAVHFRCESPEAKHLRIDVMTKMRNVDAFSALWERRTTIETEQTETIEVMSLPDLVQAKKTQRDKDWPMIRRLLEAHYTRNQKAPSDEQVVFWLNELRTPELILELPKEKKNKDRIIKVRSWVFDADLGLESCDRFLKEEEKKERIADREYWGPLKAELEKLRRSRGKCNQGRTWIL